MIEANFEPHLNSWRTEARRLLQLNTSPEEILWPGESEPSLFNTLQTVQTPTSEVLRVPQEFMRIARFVSCARQLEKWSLLYRILFRLKNETPHLLKISSDSDVQLANQWMKSVTRDIHKMHAFVRFKCVPHEGEDVYMAWHRPEHLIMEEGAPFFVRRFGDRAWCIMSPDRTALWDKKSLRFADGVPQHRFPHRDDFDELWKTYYASIFNPARLKIKAMKSEMATKYWSSLPEAELIQDLIRQAPVRLEKMAKNRNVQAIVPSLTSIEALNEATQKCQACPLYSKATQAVRGQGRSDASIMIVGEQPGDLEDLAGRPFVGPAGEVLHASLGLAGLKPDDVYLTNAVKHFKFRETGKIRLHQKPTGSEMHACRPWLEEEIRQIKPRIIVALGATAATSVLGRLPKIAQERGKVLRDSPYAEAVIISWHPAAILRASSPAEAEERRQQLTSDLAAAAQILSLAIEASK